MTIPLPQPGNPGGKPNRHGPPDLDAIESLHDKAVAMIKQVYDPEIPVNVYELGLIYKIDADEATGKVVIDMTLTSANCPEAQTLPGEVRQQVKAIPQVTECDLNMVWDPPWDKDKMSDEAKLQLGLL